MKKKIYENTGLIVKRRDPRTFKYSKLFLGVPDLSQITDFDVAEPLVIKNQGAYQTCTAYALTSVSEDQEGRVLSPEYQWYKICYIMGKYNPLGADVDSACKSVVRFGSLPAEKAPFTFPNVDPEYVANPKNWDALLDILAAPQKKQSWFEVDEMVAGNRFDSIRWALWQNRQFKRSIFAGIFWQPEWTNAPGGICEAPLNNLRTYPHAIKIFGQKTINGKIYLKVQNSWGTSVGDNGIYYLSREATKMLIFARMFIDIDPNSAKSQWNIFQAIYDLIVSLISSVKKSLGLKQKWG